MSNTILFRYEAIEIGQLYRLKFAHSDAAQHINKNACMHTLPYLHINIYKFTYKFTIYKLRTCAIAIISIDIQMNLSRFQIRRII